MADSEATPQPGTEPNNPIDAKNTEPVKTTFGFSSFTLPTPKWANAAFDIYFIVSTAFLSWVVATKLFNTSNTQEAVYFITLLLNPIVKGLSKMFGVQIQETK